MSPEQINIYEACDRAIKSLNRQCVEAFGRLKMAKWDQIHIIREVTAVYQQSREKARKRYYEVAFESYLLGLAMCGVESKKAHQMAEKAITDEWIDRVLTETDFVTLYRFDTETERKAQRLAETLEVSENRNLEIDKALKAWSRQVGQYAINFTDYAIVQAFEDAGITEVIWMTAKDERVCHDCSAMDGERFRIDEVPAKPHLNCRCRLLPVK